MIARTLSRHRFAPTRLSGASFLALALACGDVQTPLDVDAGTEAERAPDAGATTSLDAALDVDADRAEPDFSVSSSVPSVAVRAATSVEIEVTIDRLGGFDEIVRIDVSDLPSGVAANSITIPADSSSRTLEVDASGGIPGTLAEITLIASAGALTRTATFELFVVGAPGTRDQTFGSGGATTLPTELTRLRRVLATPDDKVLALGAGDDAFIALRYLGDGSLDPSFGTGGMTTVDFADVGVPEPVFNDGALQRDGKIVLTGGGLGEPTADGLRHIVIARLTADGDPDPTFGQQGRLVHKFGSRSVVASHIAIDAADRIVLAGSDLQSDPVAAFVARFTPAGLVDASFGDGGMTMIERSNITLSQALVADPTGRVVVATQACADIVCSTHLHAFDGDGRPDQAFGDDGTLVLDGGLSVAQMAALAGGDLLLATTRGILRAARPIFLRLESDGSFDENFGEGGEVEIPLAEERNGGLLALSVLDDGRVIGLGATQIDLSSDPELLLASLVNADTGEFDGAFGSGGVASEPRSSALRISLAVRGDHHLIVGIEPLASSGEAPYLLQFWR
jgi:uncharacterized delta-60 repeat protein